MGNKNKFAYWGLIEAQEKLERWQWTMDTTIESVQECVPLHNLLIGRIMLNLYACDKRLTKLLAFFLSHKKHYIFVGLDLVIDIKPRQNFRMRNEK